MTRCAAVATAAAALVAAAALCAPAALRADPKGPFAPPPGHAWKQGVRPAPPEVGPEPGKDLQLSEPGFNPDDPHAFSTPPGYGDEPIHLQPGPDGRVDIPLDQLPPMAREMLGLKPGARSMTLLTTMSVDPLETDEMRITTDLVDPGISGIPSRPPTAPPEGLVSLGGLQGPAAPAIPIPDLGDVPWGAAPGDEDQDAVYVMLLGKVVDAQTKEGIRDAEVSLPELDLRALTDRDGAYMIGGVVVRDAPHEMMIEAVGYKNDYAPLATAGQRGMLRRTTELVPQGW